MSQEQLAEPANPCVGVCDAGKQEVKICSGCFRNVMEVFQWKNMSIEDKLQVLRQVKVRKFRAGIRS